MVKPKSQSAAGRAQATPQQVDKQAAQLADALAEKDYGRKKEKPNEYKIDSEADKKSQAIGISLPPSMIEKLQDAAIKNKRGGEGPKTVSGIIREILEKEGY
ncbi:hypothetical protein ASF66_21660 [Pseudomonas sp. Leaf129]|uniref:hypothetical protein n=1 Tax=Pseudomonas sp. Leaf129 TaxID=1736268 RepID=UPI000703B9F2|nr:hypothetical protein [Pseudomonas sp. Leaf129]KQQ55022.1 hypothetical protein ASF66_21660 [Pseudomonas sp. Leaf129]